MRNLLTLAAAGVLCAGAALAQTSGAGTTSGGASGGTMGAGQTAPRTTNAPTQGGNQAVNTDTTQSVTGAPAAGANSFTEAQARSRIEAQGFQNVMDLKKDDQGIWRARASKDGRSSSVSLDFKGNVISQ